MVSPLTKPSKKRDWLRWTLPPGVSILVHGLLIGSVAYIGMQIRAQDLFEDQLPIAELALPMPTPLPERQAPVEPVSNSTPSPPSIPAYSSSLEREAADLGAIQYAQPAMDPVSLAALQSANAQIARPESTMPPTVEFAGVQTRAAQRIVYVVDGSGATANSFAYLQSHLLRSIDRLSPAQHFQVVLFRSFDQHTITLAPMNSHALVRATTENKQRVANWLAGINARGRSNPIDGLHAALKLKPDLVLLITRSIRRTEMGWAQGQRAILAELETLNPQSPTTGKRRTVIKTIQLLDEDPTGILRAIGIKHGDGNDDYRVVTYQDLISSSQSDEVNDLSTRSLGASNEQRIATAGELMGVLAASGTSLSVFYAYADPQQRERALQGAHQIRSLIRSLSNDDGRAAILDAQAALLIHIVSPGTIARSEFQMIVDRLDGVLYTEPNTDAQRVLAVALASVQLGELDRARARIIELLELADDLDLDPSSRAQAVLALASMGDIPSEFEPMFNQAPFITPAGTIDAVWGLLLRETMTKSRLVRSAPDPWLPITNLRHAARTNPSIGNYIDTRITLIFDSAPVSSQNTDLPSAVLWAVAKTMGHTLDRRASAIDLFEVIAQREENPEQAAEALWQIGVLGRAINSPGSRTRSASALTELAKRFPTHPKAPDAIASAIHATPAHQDTLLRDRLSYGIKAFPTHPQIDLWRLALAELLTDFAVLDLLDPIDPDTREGVLAGQLYEQTVLGMMDRFTDPQIRRGLDLRMRNAAARFGLPGAQMWTTRATRSEIEHDPQSALTSIDQLIAEAKAQGHPTDELELMRAQTLYGLGQTRTAFEALSRLTTQIDATGNRSSTYWQAWTLMLETIAKQGSSEEKADALRHIARLELIDSNLGGSPWNRRIMAVRQRLHSTP